MVNICVAISCKSGHATCTEKVSLFSFPLHKPDLNEHWVRFVKRTNWQPSQSSILCVQHFEEKFILNGLKSNLKWAINPLPTFHSDEVRKRPSTLPTPVIPRKAPKTRLYREDQIGSFRDNDTISSFEDLTDKHCPPGFQYKKKQTSWRGKVVSPNCVIYYNLKFDDKTSFPKVFEAIKVDKDLHVLLQFIGRSLPLPPWFIQGTEAKLKRFSMLENFPSYITNLADGNPYSLLDEIENRRYYKPRGRPPYSLLDEIENRRYYKPRGRPSFSLLDEIENRRYYKPRGRPPYSLLDEIENKRYYKPRGRLNSSMYIISITKSQKSQNLNKLPLPLVSLLNKLPLPLVSLLNKLPLPLVSLLNKLPLPLVSLLNKLPLPLVSLLNKLPLPLVSLLNKLPLPLVSLLNKLPLPLVSLLNKLPLPLVSLLNKLPLPLISLLNKFPLPLVSLLNKLPLPLVSLLNKFPLPLVSLLNKFPLPLVSLLNKFPLPLVSLLNKLQTGGVDSSCYSFAQKRGNFK